MLETLIMFATFAVLAIAAKEIGKGAASLGLPLVSGFILTGLLAGPHGLGIVNATAVPHLRFLDDAVISGGSRR